MLMEGIVGGLQKFSTDDGPGIRTTIFLKGCPLSCQWCHNPELIDPDMQLIVNPSNCVGCRSCQAKCLRDAISFPTGAVLVDWTRCNQCLECTNVCYANGLNTAGKRMTVEEVMEIARQDKDFYKHTGGGVTISGGELLCQTDFVKAIIQACEQEGIQVVLDTSGYGDYQTLSDLASSPNCTHVLYDIKAIQNDLHITLTGVGNDLILSNLKKLAADSLLLPKIMIRMPLLADINDKDELLCETGRFMHEHKLDQVALLPYHRLGVSKSLHVGKPQDVYEAPTKERLEQIRLYFESNGIRAEISA
jgi:pyruvate formate lyase activating enzyme